ncbi:putative SP-containing membrane protein [Vairimorpha necatrix]|uniref:SP-containing membrane protein n=1 Tax=Vairimorpha necatrix TaxID=6039 RepID=A0AAX4JEC4_9MICR
MIFLVFNLLTIFCSDYILIVRNNDNNTDVYVSLNNLDKVISSSILISELNDTDCTGNQIKNYYKRLTTETKNAPVYFKPITKENSDEIIKSLESCQLNDDEELEMAKIFCTNRYILKASFLRDEKKTYYIDALFVKRDQVRFVFTTSKKNVLDNDKRLQILTWMNGEIYHMKDPIKDIPSLYQKGLFTPENFIAREDNITLNFKPTKSDSDNQIKKPTLEDTPEAKTKKHEEKQFSLNLETGVANELKNKTAETKQPSLNPETGVANESKSKETERKRPSLNPESGATNETKPIHSTENRDDNTHDPFQKKVTDDSLYLKKTPTQRRNSDDSNGSDPDKADPKSNPTSSKPETPEDKFGLINILVLVLIVVFIFFILYQLFK